MADDDFGFSLIISENHSDSQDINADIDDLQNNLVAISEIQGSSSNSRLEKAKVSSVALTINLVTATLGTGILSLPWATAGASLLLGAGITFLVMMVNVCTNMILVRAAHRYGVYDLGGLLGRLPGRWAQIARPMCDAMIWISVLLCLVGYLIVFADTAHEFFPNAPRSCVVLCGGCIALLLSLLDQSSLAFSSSLCIAANMYLFSLLLVNPGSAATASNETRCIFGITSGGITMISALMQAAIVQMCSLPMYEELENRSPRRFLICSSVAFGFVTILFVSFSSLGYIFYGPGVSSNIVKDLPEDISGNIARVSMGVAVLCVYPIMLSSMIAPIKHAEERAAKEKRRLTIPSPPRSPPPVHRQISPMSPLLLPREDPLNVPAGYTPMASGLSQAPARRFQEIRYSQVATLVIVLCSILVSSVTRDLGFVNIVNGALQVAVLVGAVPAVVGYFLLGRDGVPWRCSMLLLVVIAFGASCLGFIYTDNGASDLQRQCIWSMEL